MARSSAVKIIQVDGTSKTFRDSRPFAHAAKGDSIPERYARYLQSDAWKKRRAVHLAKYPKCRGCNGVATQVHHRDYDSLGDEKERHLISVCNQCHRYIHKHIVKKKMGLWPGTWSALAYLRRQYNLS